MQQRLAPSTPALRRRHLPRRPPGRVQVGRETGSSAAQRLRCPQRPARRDRGVEVHGPRRRARARPPCVAAPSPTTRSADRVGASRRSSPASRRQRGTRGRGLVGGTSSPRTRSAAPDPAATQPATAVAAAAAGPTLGAVARLVRGDGEVHAEAASCPRVRGPRCAGPPGRPRPHPARRRPPEPSHAAAALAVRSGAARAAPAPAGHQQRWLRQDAPSPDATSEGTSAARAAPPIAPAPMRPAVPVRAADCLNRCAATGHADATPSHGAATGERPLAGRTEAAVPAPGSGAVAPTPTAADSGATAFPPSAEVPPVPVPPWSRPRPLPRRAQTSPQHLRPRSPRLPRPGPLSMRRRVSDRPRRRRPAVRPFRDRRGPGRWPRGRHHLRVRRHRRVRHRRRPRVPSPPLLRPSRWRT